MSEPAIDRLEGLIAESRSSEDAPKLYPFDNEFIIVNFNARPGTERPKIVSHKLRKPTLQELKDREGQIKSELESINSREDEEHADDAIANANLWNKIIVSVKGYKTAKEDFRELSNEEKGEMKRWHKSRAIREMYVGSCSLESSDDDEVSIGAETWTIRQEIGLKSEPDFIIRHSLREPNKREWEKFSGTRRRVSYVRGAKRTRTKIKTGLQAYCDLYDAVILSVDGGTVGGQPLNGENRKACLSQVDPIWKRKTIETLIETLEGQSSD